MESHTDTATVEAPAESDNPIDSLPQETTQDSFLDALDAALDNINNPESAGSLSWHVLWGESTSRQQNIKSYKRKFNLT